MEEICQETLLEHYESLLELYQNLEAASCEVFRALESLQSAECLTAKLKIKMAIVERIGTKSKTIAAMKKSLAERNQLSDKSRTCVRQAEHVLEETVGRLIEQDEKTHEIMLKQGVKISRR